MYVRTCCADGNGRTRINSDHLFVSGKKPSVVLFQVAVSPAKLNCKLVPGDVFRHVGRNGWIVLYVTKFVALVVLSVRVCVCVRKKESGSLSKSTKCL